MNYLHKLWVRLSIYFIKLKLLIYLETQRGTVLIILINSDAATLCSQALLANKSLEKHLFSVLLSFLFNKE